MNYIAPTLEEAYTLLLTDLVEADPAPGYKATDAEVLGASVVLTEPTYNLIASKGRAFNYRYMVAEMMWNAQPSDMIAPLKWVMPSVEDFVQDQPEGTRDHVAWAYGASVYPGLVDCYGLLQEDPGTRRAVIRVEEPMRHVGTPPCLVSIQFIQREGRLHAFTQMRSNDAWRGFPLDVYQFTMWQIFLASALNLGVGTYNHSIGSLHLYTRDRDAATNYLDKEREAIQSSTPTEEAFQDILDCSWGLALATQNIDQVRDKRWVSTYLNDPEHMGLEFRGMQLKGIGRW